jgi:hypothetical protein
LGSPELVLEALRRLQNLMTDSAAPRDDTIAALPVEPLLELPELFQMAREGAGIENADDRDAELRRVAERYPSVAGAIILQDGK